ncbi:phosphotransferase [Marinomonas sp. A79]|uniref:Phosphotransferase n=1 Tax=Marinomonas vulgaris TaxID=2823372 RepID=A0ABS5HF50_9GAMM|nr:phosphotransferase [Marinomonas vulgaris]MBR7890278.1 phosphotransferase [Marinomonas vulgaris]
MAGAHHQDFIDRLTKGVESVKHHWGIDSGARVRLLTLSENATFIVEASDHKPSIILRVHRLDYHSHDEILSELDWIGALRKESQINIPEPLPLKDNSYIASFDDEGQTRYVVAFEFMAGKEPSENDSLSDGFELLGKISAELHNHASQWKLPTSFQRKSWTFQTSFGDKPLWGDWREAIDLNADDQDILETLCQTLKVKLDEYGTQEDRFGLIHADLRLSNLLMEQDTLSVIDFDDCGFSWFMYDFAAAISFYETSPQVPALTEAWLKGYRSVRLLEQQHEDMIPTFILFRRLLLTAWIASHSETETAIEAGLGDYTKGTVALAQQYLKGDYLRASFLEERRL